MKRILLALSILIAGISAASAACVSPAVMKDNASTTFNMSLATAPDTNCASNVAIPTWAGGTLGAMANYGTSPGAVLVPGVNAFVTNTPAVTQSGTWTVQPGNTANTTPWLVTGSGTAGAAASGVLSVQGIASMTPVQVSQSAPANLQVTDTPVSLSAWGLVASTQNGATPTNGQLAMGQFNTTPTTITSGNVSPLQMDSAGNLLVNIKAGASSGGTALADESAFTQGTTSITPIGCLFINSYTALTTGHAGVLSCTSAGSLHTTVDNSNSNGLATMANSSPVVVASDQKVSTQNASVAINISTATTTQLVAISGSTKIYVTAWDVIAGGTGNITLEYGTGSNCGTGTTVLTGAYNLTAQAGISKGDGSAPVLIVPSGNALCALTSAAVQMSGSVTYQQF